MSGGAPTRRPADDGTRDVDPAFGIDHPLIAVEDLERVRERLCSVGFGMTPPGMHPWGTGTSLAGFAGCLLEIVSVRDARLLDEKAVPGFRFGRHVQRHLAVREGVALTALHSLDPEREAARARAAGFEVSGRIEFGRDVVLPDGTPDRTRTTLVPLPDREHERLSFFLCCQHRRDLVEVPGWMAHANAVVGIGGITVLAGAASHERVARRLGGLFGPPGDVDGGFDVSTANGTISVRTRAAIERELGPLPEALGDERSPSVVGMTFRSADMRRTTEVLAASGEEVRERDGAIVLSAAHRFGNTFLRFGADAEPRSSTTPDP